jgi:hypothetical protein
LIEKQGSTQNHPSIPLTSNCKVNQDLTIIIHAIGLLHYGVSMTEKNIRRLMLVLIFVGLALIAYGFYLIIFTGIVTSAGAAGIFKIAGFIAGGLFIIVPAKIYLTLQLMKYNDEKLQAENAKKVRRASEAADKEPLK